MGRCRRGCMGDLGVDEKENGMLVSCLMVVIAFARISLAVTFVAIVGFSLAMMVIAISRVSLAVAVIAIAKVNPAVMVVPFRRWTILCRGC